MTALFRFASSHLRTPRVQGGRRGLVFVDGVDCSCRRGRDKADIPKKWLAEHHNNKQTHCSVLNMTDVCCPSTSFCAAVWLIHLSAPTLFAEPFSSAHECVRRSLSLLFEGVGSAPHVSVGKSSLHVHCSAREPRQDVGGGSYGLFQCIRT
jgi:hypothetical protein